VRKISEPEARSVFKKIQNQRKDLELPEAIATKDADEVAADLSDIIWTERLLGVIGQIEPAAFERLCQRLLRESGFIKVEVTGRPSDGGIDGIGVLRMNLVSFQVLFQCKRYKGTVGAGVVRDFRGAMVGRADKGLIITTGTFTSDARKEATRDGAPAIDLIDGENLCILLKDRRLGVQVQLVEEINVDDKFFKSI
jgi:restriction system protein